MRMGPNYMLPPALEAMDTYWSAWDEELDENHRVHFAILDIPLFRSMLEHRVRGSGRAYTHSRRQKNCISCRPSSVKLIKLDEFLVDMEVS